MTLRGTVGEEWVWCAARPLCCYDADGHDIVKPVSFPGRICRTKIVIIVLNVNEKPCYGNTAQYFAAVSFLIRSNAAISCRNTRSCTRNIVEPLLPGQSPDRSSKWIQAIEWYAKPYRDAATDVVNEIVRNHHWNGFHHTVRLVGSMDQDIQVWCVLLQSHVYKDGPCVGNGAERGMTFSAASVVYVHNKLADGFIPHVNSTDMPASQIHVLFQENLKGKSINQLISIHEAVCKAVVRWSAGSAFGIIGRRQSDHLETRIRKLEFRRLGDFLFEIFQPIRDDTEYLAVSRFVLVIVLKEYGHLETVSTPHLTTQG